MISWGYHLHVTQITQFHFSNLGHTVLITCNWWSYVSSAETGHKMQTTVFTWEHCNEDQVKGCMDSPEHQCELKVDPGATGPGNAVQSTSIQSGLTENLDKASTNIIMKKELLYFALFVCLFIQTQSAYTFLTFLNRVENWTTREFFSLFLKSYIALIFPVHCTGLILNAPPQSLPIHRGSVLS